MQSARKRRSSVRAASGRPANDEPFFGEVTIESERPKNGLAAHTIEAGDINQAKLTAAGNSPLGKSAFEPFFADDDHSSHGQHLVEKVL